MALTNITDITDKDVTRTKNLLTNRLSGIEGIPYQFLSTVDQRIPGTQIGRKYADKIISRLPLLFLTPCRPVFMDEFGDMDKETALSFLSGAVDATSDLINGKGRYYSVEYDYLNYYNYVNCMLSSVAAFLGIYDETIVIKGQSKKIGTYRWENEMNEAFKTFFSAKENVIFYLDALDSVNETYSNDTTESSLASMINGFSDTANEIKFLFGEKSNVMASIIDGTSEVVSSIGQSLSSFATSLGGGIVGSLMESGVQTVVNGGKIVFPKIWNNSSASRSYSIEIKLRSPDNDSLSIYLNVLKPYCKLLAMALPRLMDEDIYGRGMINPNGYRSPFMVKAFSKGMFNIDYGMITSMNVQKGATCCWNDDGLPTQIDISLEIEDLYSSLAMSKLSLGNIGNVVANSSYMDFLANMAGLNIAQMEIGRRITMYYYLTQTSLRQIPSKAFTRFDQSISRLMGSLYNRLS